MTIKNLSKVTFLIFVIISSFLFGIYFFSQVSSVMAQDVDAIPDPKVPCWDESPKGWSDPEFNSLRPYQASPCQESQFTAQMCGNEIIVKLDNVDVNYCGNEWCPDNEGLVEKEVYIDLSGVDLPILGNTELTTNSDNPTDQIDDGQKVNEYLSWYLSGTNQKAEFGIDDIAKTINFSGPLKKLLPSAIQEFIRFKSLHNAGVKDEVIDPETGEPLVDPITKSSEETYNHNQIVVCTEKNIFGITNPWLGTEKPVPCYDGGDQAVGKQYRLLKWWEGKEVGLIDSKKILPDWDGSKRWGSTVPPFPWQFEKDIYYKKAYQEWKGKECLLVLGRLVCADIKIPGVAELHTNVYADFYQYIPLSNTTDKEGKQFYNNVAVRGNKNDARMKNLATTYEILKVPKLFFPHTISTAESLENLNSTYLPKDGIDIKIVPGSAETNTECKILDVRTNPGDSLTFENTKEKQQIAFKAYYDIEEIRCKETGSTRCVIPNPLGGCFKYEPVFDCSTDVTATINLETYSPYLRTIWEQAVAGEGSTFRKIFPKVEEGAPVSCIADIPGASGATYALNGESSDSVEITSVRNPEGATASTPEIYFPHLGSVYEYMLKGIQTALRPKGYGEPIANGKLCSNLEGGDCSFDMAKINQAMQKASVKYNVPVVLLRAVFELESLKWIANPSSYKCEENSAGAAGIAQMKKETVDQLITCNGEQMDNDIGMCGNYRPKLSRCTFDDAFELMARLLLLHAGKLNNCQATGSMSIANKMEWYNATCLYGTGFEPNATTINYQNGIPASERRQDGDMNYCDIICHKLGQCPPYPVR